MPKVFVHPRRKEVKPRVKNLSKKWKKRPKVSRGWRLLRGIVFIVCFTLFFFQSTKFLQLYYRYPTVTKIEFTSPKEFEYPAVTFCNQNPIKRTKFCAEYPDLCQRPSNITELCKELPYLCKHNPLDLVIPKFGFQANNSHEEIRNVIREIYYSGNVTKEFWEEWAWSFESSVTKREIKPVFAVTDFYYPCFTENLLLNCTDEAEKIDLDESKELGYYTLNLTRSEEMYFNDGPVVSFLIHSPFVPVRPFEDGIILKVGHKYNVYIKLEEENLLPFPYDTDCITYEDLWNEGNPQRPRSQEMCKYLCLHSLLEQNKNVTLKDSMLFEYPIELNFGRKCNISSEDGEILERCRSNCKPSCSQRLNLVVSRPEIKDDRRKKMTDNLLIAINDLSATLWDWRKEIFDPDYERDTIQVQIFLVDRQVAVKNHSAKYDTGDLFSYIGGLIGCWLGISIWAFAGIAENVFRRALQWTEKIKRCLKKTFQAPHSVFSTHRDKELKSINI